MTSSSSRARRPMAESCRAPRTPASSRVGAPRSSRRRTR